MKSLFLLFALLLTCLPSSSTVVRAQKPEATGDGSKYLKTKFDKKKNLTTVSLKTLPLSGSMTQEVGNLAEVPQLDLDGSFTFAGERVVTPVEAATLTFKTVSRYPVYQRSQNVVVVLDDDRALLLGATDYKGNSRTFSFEEVLSISIPFDAMQKIAEATSFKFVIGAREIKFKEKEIQALREFARAMNPVLNRAMSSNLEAH